MAVSGVRSSCETLATKSRRITSSRRSSLTSWSTSTSPNGAPSGSQRRAPLTCSVDPSPPPSVTSRESVEVPAASWRSSSAICGSRASSISGCPRPSRPGGTSSSSCARSFMSTIRPARSVTTTPSTMPRRIASSRSRSTRSAVIVVATSDAISASCSSSTPRSSARSAARYGGGAPLASVRAKATRRWTRRSSRRETTIATASPRRTAMRSPPRRSRRRWATFAATVTSGIAERTTRTSSPRVWRQAAYRSRAPTVALIRTARPLPPRSAARISGRSAWFSSDSEERVDSPSTRPSDATTVRRTPRSSASRAQAASRTRPDAHGNVSPATRASARRRSASVSIWCCSTVTATYGIATSSAPTSATSVGTRNWTTRLRLERVGIELVADTADGEDELRVRIISLEALPQPAHVDVHGPRLDVHLGSPYEVQEGEPIVHPMGVADEELEQLELPEGKTERLPVEEELVGVEVEPEPPALEHLVRRAWLLGQAPPEHGVHPGHQLAGAERLGHVVVGPELQAEDTVDLGGARREDDDRQRARRLGGAEPAADLEPVDPGQHEVEDHQRRALHLDERERALPRLRLADGVAALLEVKAHELADVLLVLDHEDAPLHGHRTQPGPG